MRSSVCARMWGTRKSPGLNPAPAGCLLGGNHWRWLWTLLLSHMWSRWQSTAAKQCESSPFGHVAFHQLLPSFDSQLVEGKWRELHFSCCYRHTYLYIPPWSSLSPSSSLFAVSNDSSMHLCTLLGCALELWAMYSRLHLVPSRLSVLEKVLMTVLTTYCSAATHCIMSWMQSLS